MGVRRISGKLRLILTSFVLALLIHISLYSEI